jgi:septum formation protein
MRAPWLVLASTSRFRVALFESMGLEVTTVSPRFVEDDAELAKLASALGRAPTPKDVACYFAEQKVRSVDVEALAERASREGRRCFVIGADQTLDLDGELLRKPDVAGGSHAARREVALHDAMVTQLGRLQGRSHRLCSAVAVMSVTSHMDGQSLGTSSARAHVETRVATVHLRMRALDAPTLRRYVTLDWPEGAVGSYLFERRGRLLFDAVDGDDATIMGLPWHALQACFSRWQVDLLDGITPSALQLDESR